MLPPSQQAGCQSRFVLNGLFNLFREESALDEVKKYKRMILDQVVVSDEDVAKELATFNLIMAPINLETSAEQLKEAASDLESNRNLKFHKPITLVPTSTAVLSWVGEALGQRSGLGAWRGRGFMRQGQLGRCHQVCRGPCCFEVGAEGNMG